MKLIKTKDGSLLVAPSGQKQNDETKALALIFDEYNRAEANAFLALGMNPIVGFMFFFGPTEQVKSLGDTVTKGESVPSTKRGFLHPTCSKIKKEESR